MRDGFIMTVPFTIGGSIFLLLANIPVPGYAEFVGETFINSMLAVSNATFSILAIFVLLSISYHYALREGCDANMASCLSIATFFILLPDTSWLGANGLITAVMVAFYSSFIFCNCTKRGWVIKLPSSVPRAIIRSFNGVLPAIILFTTAVVMNGVLKASAETTLPELVFRLIQMPLQGLSDSLVGASIIISLQSFFFWLGVHGPNLMSGIVTPLVTANSMDNQALIEAGVQGIENYKIFTSQVEGVLVRAGGCGATFGLIIASLLTAKSRQIKSITKVAIIPGLFNINEPLIFGLPIMFNPYLILPYILAPLSNLYVVWFALKTGFMEPIGALILPWTTPPVLYGFLLSGTNGAIVQIICILLSTLIYLPFLKIQDRECLEEEAEEGEELKDDTLI